MRTNLVDLEKCCKTHLLSLANVEFDTAENEPFKKCMFYDNYEMQCLPIFAKGWQDGRNSSLGGPSLAHTSCTANEGLHARSRSARVSVPFSAVSRPNVL